MKEENKYFSRKGFTLIEIVLYVALSAIIGLVLVTFFIQAIKKIPSARWTGCALAFLALGKVGFCVWVLCALQCAKNSIEQRRRSHGKCQTGTQCPIGCASS